MLPPRVKAAMNLRQFGIRDARIYLSRDDRRVSQQPLNMTNVGPVLEQVRRKGMPYHVRRGTSEPSAQRGVAKYSCYGLRLKVSMLRRANEFGFRHELLGSQLRLSEGQIYAKVRGSLVSVNGST